MAKTRYRPSDKWVNNEVEIPGYGKVSKQPEMFVTGSVKTYLLRQGLILPLPETPQPKAVDLVKEEPAKPPFQFAKNYKPTAKWDQEFVDVPGYGLVKRQDKMQIAGRLSTYLLANGYVELLQAETQVTEGEAPKPKTQPSEEQPPKEQSPKEQPPKELKKQTKKTTVKESNQDSQEDDTSISTT